MMRVWREKHKQRTAATNKAYREANKSQIAAYNKSYCAANKLRCAARKKSYCAANKLRCAASYKSWAMANKSRIAANQKKWRQSNKVKDAATHKAYRTANKQRCAAATKLWYTENKQRSTATNRAYKRHRRATDPAYRLLCNLRSRMGLALNGNLKADRTLALVGCSAQECKDHLAAQFVDGMTWENRTEWQVDHIKPCAAFDLSIESEQRACFHYTNLQPLWAADNLAKGALWEGKSARKRKRVDVL